MGSDHKVGDPQHLYGKTVGVEVTPRKNTATTTPHVQS